METVGLIGVGKIGLPIAENLIKSGYRVLGYRRGSHGRFREDRRRSGALARRDRRAGRHRAHLLAVGGSARRGGAGQERPGARRRGRDRSSSNSARIWCPTRSGRSRRSPPRAPSFSTAKSAARPAWSSARKAVVYLAGDAEAAKKAEHGDARLHRHRATISAPFGAASKVKLINNLLVPIHIAATAEAMALGLKAGVDVDLMIKAVAAGSGGSTQFGIRAPWMAQRRFLPAQGNVPGPVALFRADRRAGRPMPAWRRRCSTAPSSFMSGASRWALASSTMPS